MIEMHLPGGKIVHDCPKSLMHASGCLQRMQCRKRLECRTPFAYQHSFAGLCTGVAKAVTAIAEGAKENLPGHADLTTYVHSCGLHGCHARIQWPNDYGWFQGARKRIPG